MADPATTRSSITGNFFVNLINRLGVRPPPREGFNIQNTVIPVSLVDADISLPVATSTVLVDAGNTFTQGNINGAGAGALLADTGAQPAGNYTATIFAGSANPDIQATFLIQRRDAANATTIWQGAISYGTGNSLPPFSVRLVLNLNERLRCVQGPNANASGNQQVTISLVAG
jgi:hypothetical protein